MALKDLKKYYDEQTEAYIELKKNLKEMEGQVDEERLAELKANINPLLVNYKRIAYIMFLLNRPNKKSKVKDYERRNKKLLSSLGKSNTLEQINIENRDILNNLNQFVDKE